jgi:hypothetical protein
MRWVGRHIMRGYENNKKKGNHERRLGDQGYY